MADLNSADSKRDKIFRIRHLVQKAQLEIICFLKANISNDFFYIIKENIAWLPI